MSIYQLCFKRVTIAKLLTYIFIVASYQAGFTQSNLPNNVKVFPAAGAVNVNPDTYLQLTFDKAPTLHNSGKIQIYDTSNNNLVDELDLSIPPGPKNTRMPASYYNFIYKNIPDSLYTSAKPEFDTTHIYQVNYIGGTLPTDNYHFYPVLINGNTANIYLHNNHLAYGKTYYVTIDSDVLSVDGSAFQIKDKDKWCFSTKKKSPAKDAKKLIVASNGTGDFTTIQGAVDFIPEHNTNPVSIYIMNGTYHEIINCRNRTNLQFIGESRGKTILSYANNGVFNLRQMSADPQLSKGLQSLRPVMSVYNASDINIANLTIISEGEKPAQAEALLVLGDKIIVDNVSIEGSGDALQATGRIYVNNSKIQGLGDNVLGYGAVFFNNCEFISTHGPHIWVRNTDKNHGNVLLNCTLTTLNGLETEIARAPDNHGTKYPYAETVLINCKVKGISPAGWGTVTDSTENIKYWEYHTTAIETGKAVDISQRHPASKQLTIEKDADLINKYKTPSFVLDGWNPELISINNE